MSLWGKIFGRKGKREEKKRVSIREALEISRKRLAEQDLSAAQKLVGEIRAAVSDVSLKAKALSDAKPPKMYKPLEAPVLESRKQIVMSLQKALDEIKFSDELTCEKLQKLYVQLGKAIAKLSSVNIKHSYYVSVGFQQHADAVRRAAVSLGELSNRLGVELQRISLENAPYKKILEKNDELEKLIKAGETTGREMTETQETVKEIEKIIADISTEIEKSRTSERQEELLSVQRQKADVENKIFCQISVFSRAMRKYEHVGVFDKKTGAVLRSYLESPVRALLSDDDFVIQKILADVRRLLEKNELGLKDSDKTIAALDSLDYKTLKGLGEEYKVLETNEKMVGEKLRPLLERQEVLKGELGSTVLKLKSAKVRQEHLKKMFGEQEQKLNGLRTELDQMVENFPA